MPSEKARMLHAIRLELLVVGMAGRLFFSNIKSALGDALPTMLCGADHNLRMILRAIWLFYGQYSVSQLQWLLLRPDEVLSELPS